MYLFPGSYYLSLPSSLRSTAKFPGQHTPPNEYALIPKVSSTPRWFPAISEFGLRVYLAPSLSTPKSTNSKHTSHSQFKNSDTLCIQTEDRILLISTQSFYTVSTIAPATMSTTICRIDSPVTRMESMETQSAQFGSTTHDQTILANYDEEDFENDSEYGEIEYDSEGKYGYDSGWFYPICIGDKITIKTGDAVQDRYQISHRLGWGGFSTVWLAQDLCLERAVALKVLAPGDAGNKEYNIQETVAHSVEDSSHLILCNTKETFLLQGPNGTHRVLVLPLAGPNLMTLATGRPIHQRMSAAKQVLEAIASLHEAGLVHGGKLPTSLKATRLRFLVLDSNIV